VLPAVPSLFAAPIAGWIMKKRVNYKQWCMVSMVGYVVMNLIFILTLYSGNKYIIMLGFTIGGLFNAPLFAFVLELSCELVFPIGEASAGGFM